MVVVVTRKGHKEYSLGAADIGSGSECWWQCHVCVLKVHKGALKRYTHFYEFILVSTGKTTRIQSQLYLRQNILKHASLKGNYWAFPMIVLKIITKQIPGTGQQER